MHCTCSVSVSSQWTKNYIGHENHILDSLFILLALCPRHMGVTTTPSIHSNNTSGCQGLAVPAYVHSLYEHVKSPEAVGAKWVLPNLPLVGAVIWQQSAG